MFEKIKNKKNALMFSAIAVLALLALLIGAMEGRHLKSFTKYLSLFSFAQISETQNFGQEEIAVVDPYAGKIEAAKELKRKNPQAKEIIQKVSGREEAQSRGLLNSKKFDLGNGINRYIFFSGDINYVDPATGDIKEADPFFTADPDGTFTMDTASYKAIAPQFADEPMSFILDGEATTFQPVKLDNEKVSHAPGILNGQRVLYLDAFGLGIDYVIQAEADELRKLIVFRFGMPAPTNDIKIEFETSLSHTTDIYGENTKLGKVYMRQPMVWDANNVAMPIAMKLGGNKMIKIIPKEFFIRDPESPLLYPVTTDATTSYYAGVGDGTVTNVTAGSWSTVHDASIGSSADYTNPNGTMGSSFPGGNYSISRAFFPIDTSGIADSDEITAVRLKVYITTITNEDNDGDDWLNVVQTTQAVNSALTTADFDTCGAITNPTEGATRIDFSLLTASSYNTWTLNSTGEGWVSKTASTNLGLREGHDAINSATGVADTVIFYTSEQTGTANDPVLEVDTTAASLNYVTRLNDDSTEIFATSTEGIDITANFTGETAGNTTVEYVFFLDYDGDNTPDTNETYITNNCAGSALWSSGQYTHQTSAFTIADGASPKNDTWSCLDTNFSSENGKYKIYTKWYDANGTIAATGTPMFQYCDQPTGSNNWWWTNYENRAVITFRSSTFTSAMIDFPVLVKATSTNQVLDDMETSGDDVRFIDDDGSTPLSFEREFYDATTTQEAYWWVRVPKIATSTDCDYISMYYDYSASTSTSSTTAPWRQDYYEAVYHFGEYATSSATTYSFQNGVSPTAGYAGFTGTLIGSSAQTTNYWNQTTYNADAVSCTQTGLICRALHTWDISTLTSCTVSGATSTIWMTNNTADTNNAVYAVRRNWKERTATWTIADTGVAWTTLGGDDTTNDRYSTNLMDGNTQGGWNSAATAPISVDHGWDHDGRTAIQNWIDGAVSNYGIIIINTGGDSYYWNTSTASTASQRPILTIRCGTAAAEPTYLDATSFNHDETNSSLASRKEKSSSKFGYSPKFNTSASAIGIPDSSGWDLRSYTITGWLKRDGKGTNCSVCGGTGSVSIEVLTGKGYAEADSEVADTQWIIGVTNDALLAADYESWIRPTANNNPITARSRIATSTWTHFGYRMASGTTEMLYLSGFSDAAIVSTPYSPSAGSTQKVGIAASYNTAGTAASSAWNGYLDEIRIYKVALATTTASNESEWLRAEWYTADNGYVVWGTEATTTSAAANSITQIHYRWRNDDGNEAAATWGGAEDTATSSVKFGEIKRLRMEVSNEGTASSSQRYILQYGTNSDATSENGWMIVPQAVDCATSSPIIIKASQLTDGSATTDVASGLTNENTTFRDGEQKDSTATTTHISLDSTRYTEIEYSIQVTNKASDNITYYFRLATTTGNGTVGKLDAYTVTPALTTSDTAALYVADDCDGQAWEGQTVSNGGMNDGSENEFTSGEYTSVSVDDSNRVQDDSSATNGLYQYHRFAFPINQPAADIKSITVTWRGVGGAGPVASFTSDTLVKTFGGDIDIAKIYTQYKNDDTAELPLIIYLKNNQTRQGHIKGALQHPYDGEMIILNLVNKKNVHVTPSHQLLFDPIRDSYVNAGRVKAGDFLIGENNEKIAVESIERYGFCGYVYDLSIQEFHNFLLSSGIFVHNTYPLGNYGHSLWVKESGAWVSKGSGTLDSKQTLSITYATTTAGFVNLISNGLMNIGAQSDVPAVTVSYGSTQNSYYIEVSVSTAAPNISQPHYRWRNDDGSETLATWGGTEDTATSSVGIGKNIRLRLEASNKGAATWANQYILQFGTGSDPQSGTWTTVPASGSCGTAIFCMNGSSYFADGAVTTNVAAGLTDDNTTFTAGEIKDLNATTTILSLSSLNFAEIEYNFQVTANAAEGTTYYFRLATTTGVGDANQLNTYTVTPQLTTVGGTANLTQSRYRWRNDDGNEVAASWGANENTATTSVGISKIIRLRMEVSNEGTASSSQQYILQFGTGTDPTTGTWTTVPASGSCGSAIFCMDSTSQLSESASSTTNVASGLTDDNTEFRAGDQKDTNATTTHISLGTTRFTEIEYAFQVTTNAAYSTAYYFRLATTTGIGDASQLNTYTVTPQLTTVAPTVGTITSLTTNKSSYATSTENIDVAGTYGATGSNISNSVIEYVAYLDYNGNGSPDAGEVYITNSCAGSAAWSSGNYSHQTTGFNVTAGGSTNDTWSCANTNFPENGHYQIYSKWYLGGTTYDEATTTPFDSCDQPIGKNTWWNASYENRRIMQFSNQNRNEALINFPVLMLATTTNFDLNALNSPSEIRFIDSDGSTVLNHELEIYATTTEALFWLNIPKIATTTACDYVTMYYDYTGAADVATTTGVWDENYMAVYHFGETSGNYLDSTRNAEHCTTVSVTSRTTAGFFGGYAPDFEATAAANRLTCGQIVLRGDMTHEVMFKLESAQTNPITQHAAAGEAGPDNVIFGFETDSSNNFWTQHEHGAGTNVSLTTTVNASLAEWTMGTFARSSSTVEQYLWYKDGSYAGASTYTDDPTGGDSGTALYVGGRISSGVWYDGLADELRISNSVRSANWLAASASSTKLLYVNWGAEATTTCDIALVQSTSTAHVYGSTGNTSITATLLSPATAGNVLITAVGTDKSAGTYTQPSGFTLIHSYAGASVSGAMAYKIAAGGETSVQWQNTTDNESALWVGEYSGLAASNVLDIGIEADSADAVVTSLSSGTSGATAQADELAIAMMAADTQGSVDGTRAWSNGFTEKAWIADSNNGAPGLSIATTTLTSIGTQQTTYSCVDTGDQMYVVLATFKAARSCPSTSSNFDQIHYRWRNDDGSEATASWGSNEDTATSSVGIGKIIRLRMEVSNEGTASSSQQYILQFGTGTDPKSGTWTTVPASGSCGTAIFCMDSTSSLTESASSTTNVASGLTDSNTEFRAGSQKDANATTTHISLDSTRFTEIEFGFQVTSNAAQGTAYYFRLATTTGIGDANQLNTYTVTPQLTTYSAPTISSNANQTFTAGDPATLMATTTITNGSPSVITAANDIRVVIPAPLDMTWDETATTTLYMSPVLADYSNFYNTNDLPVVTVDTSDVIFNPLTNTLFFVRNTVGTETIYEHNLDGTNNRTIALHGFNDTEGITWMYGTTYAVSQEAITDPVIIIFSMDNATTTVDRASIGTVITPTMTINANNGMEGISYDPLNDWFYVAVEKQAAGGNGGRVFQVEMDNTTTELTALGTALLSAGYNDLASIYYDRVSGHLFLMAEEQNTVIEATTGGTIITTRAVDTGIFTQPEGLSFSPDGSSMFIAGEADDYQRLTKTNKVGNPVTYENSNKTLVLNVTSDFTAGEAITIGGINFKNFNSASGPDYLDLVVAGFGGAVVASDDKTKTINSSGLSVVASSTLAFSSPIFSFAVQTSTATDVGGFYVAGGGGTWTFNISCMDSPSDCMWKGATEKDRFSMHRGVAATASASTSGILCADWAQLSCGTPPCTGVTLSSGYNCYSSAKTDIQIASGSAATGNYWLKESDWYQGIPGSATASMYTTTIIFDLF